MHQYAPEEGGVGKTGLGVYADGMVEHDAMVGQLLDKLKELGLDQNTIVMYTDNGAEKFSWPDGGTAPFRGEKNSNWEGAYAFLISSAGPASSSPHSLQRHLCPRRHGSHADGRRGRAGREGAVAQRHEGQQQDLQGASRRLNITDALLAKCPARAREFFYFNDNGSLVGSTISGRSPSRSSAPTVSTSGGNRSWCCAGRRSSTSALIRSRSATLILPIMTIGGPIERS